MSKKSVLIWSVLVTGLLCTFVLVFISKSPKSESGHTSGVTQTDKAENELAKSVSVPNSKTQTYELRFDEEGGKVELVTKKADGTQIITAVESINPYYLTDEDIAALKEGIELENREDMYILIEDLSS